MPLARLKLWYLPFKAKNIFFVGLWFCFTAITYADPEVQAAPVSLSPSELYMSPTNGLGSWIWATNTFDGQRCQFWRSFEIPKGEIITKARLVMTVDNEFTVYLDGRELGRGAEWRELFEFDLTPLLTAGWHVVAVKGINSFSQAGMLLGLQIVFGDGKNIEIKSDSSWKIVPEEASRWENRIKAEADWQPATIIAPLGGSPWWSKPVDVNKMPVLQPIRTYFWQAGWFQIMLLSMCGVVILFSLQLMAQLALHRKERWLLYQERARIAREIHDDIGARMTQLVLHGEIAQSEVAEGSEVNQHLAHICEDARSLLLTMDEILWAVNPQRDTLRDFTAFVSNYAEGFLKPTRIQCLFEIDSEMSASVLELPLRRSLLMAIKEALNNAVKHSEATELLVKIQWQGQRLIVVLQDNGKGFDSAKTNSERHGLVNMTQRMVELGGACYITSQPENGCRIEFNVPLKRPQRSRWSRIWNPLQFLDTRMEQRNEPLNNALSIHDPNQL